MGKQNMFIKENMRNCSVKTMELEKQYEQFVNNSEVSKNKEVRCLLPIKTKEGHIEKRILSKSILIDRTPIEEKNIITSEYIQKKDLQNTITSEVISTIQLLACREKKLKFIRYNIGILSSEILENPEMKLNNLSLLLNYMDEGDLDVYITVKKMSTASLFEIFHDILPVYNVWLLDKDKVKFKKETLMLHKHEELLIKYYQQYLQKLEKMAHVVKKSKHTQSVKQHDIILGTFAIDCMTKLLVTRPYFNFSSNVAHFLIPFLDSNQSNIRQIVAKCFAQIFREDIRGELTLTIIRYLNQYIKVHKQFMHFEVIQILVNLRIEDISLDKTKENSNNYEKLTSYKKRVLTLSKIERKRKFKLEQIEKQMLETKAEENNSPQLKIFTEITTLLFMIYLRILKNSPGGPILSSCLEGLTKFAQCLNMDYYQDVVNLLNNLLDKDYLKFTERIHCINAALKLLFGHVSASNIDPVRFYIHLYKIILNIHLGEKDICTEDLIENLSCILINNCTNISENRLMTFLKRLFTIMLNLQHDSIMGIASTVRLILHNFKFTNTLVDTEHFGNCIDLADFIGSDCFNPDSTSLWEIPALLRYYHSSVQHTINIGFLNIPSKTENSVKKNVLKTSPKNIFLQYNSSVGVFQPTITKPKDFQFRNIQRLNLRNKFIDLSHILQFQKIFNDEYLNLFQDIKCNFSKK